MAVSLNIQWLGRSAADFARQFDIAANVSDFRPVFQDIAQKVVAPSIAENFQAGGRPKWAPLAESTKIKKAKLGQSSRILVATGALEERASDPSKYKITRTELKAAPFGIPYWGYHQIGTPKMPYRVIMMLQAADRTKINSLFADYMRQFMTFDPRLSTTRQFTGGQGAA